MVTDMMRIGVTVYTRTFQEISHSMTFRDDVQAEGITWCCIACRAWAMRALSSA